MKMTLSILFVAGWITLGHCVAGLLIFSSEFITSLARAGFALFWLWSMWILVDLILHPEHKN